MTYRDRRLAKAERLRGYAESNEQKSATALERAQRIADGIPFGQPILVGHHSEGRARRDHARIVSGMDKGIEHAQKAEEQNRRADGIERAADHAIYSDDPDAIERLEERIAELEKERKRKKAYNASCRKGSPDPWLITEAEREELLSWARVRYQEGPVTFGLTNLSADIRRNKQRLEALREQKSNPPVGRWITSRYHGSHCEGCGVDVQQGQQAFYCPAEKTIYCRGCGEVMESGAKGGEQ